MLRDVNQIHIAKDESERQQILLIESAQLEIVKPNVSSASIFLFGFFLRAT